MWASHVPPSKDFEKFGHKNAINTKIEDPLDFLTAPNRI
jgi:hypothetical protein